MDWTLGQKVDKYLESVSTPIWPYYQYSPSPQFSPEEVMEIRELLKTFRQYQEAFGPEPVLEFVI